MMALKASNSTCIYTFTDFFEVSLSMRMSQYLLT